MKSKLLFLVLLSLAGLSNVCAQDNTGKRLAQDVYPQGFDNYMFAMFYYNDKTVYGIRKNKITQGELISDLKINPSYTSFALLNKNKKGYGRVNIYDTEVADRFLKGIKIKDASAMAIAYSKDAKQLAIAASDSTINIYNAIDNKPLKSYISKFVPTKMTYSENNYFLVASDGMKLEIWNLERGTVRTTLNFEVQVNDFIFNNNSSQLLVATANGKLNVFDTKTFKQQQTIDDLGQALACYPNSDGKYVAVVNNGNRISVVNLLDPTERHFLDNNEGGTNTVRVVYNIIDNKHYIIYNNKNNLIYTAMELTPYYNKMMTTMLSERMNQWMKQMPDETLEAYKLRVNDSTRTAQVQAIEREIATQMATGLIEESEMSVGNYNTSSKALALHFNNMPDIFLDVPMDDLNDFGADSKLEFRNAKYGLNPDDKFELVYAEVYNPKNGKTYIFDNMERRSLAKMQEDDNYVPLEIIQKSNMEETALMTIKEDAMNLAKQDQVITDKTHISVKTEAVPAVNADGEKIVNYNVQFTYEVEEEFSARDDFKPGRYHVEESKAAMLMLQIMTKAFETDFKKYMVEGKRVKIKVKGSADASPIARALAYDGKYGEFAGEPVYKNDELGNITLNKKDGMADNDQLAFARALGVKNYIENDITGFAGMNTDYEYHIEVSQQEGSQFRRISVQYTFVDAF